MLASGDNTGRVVREEASDPRARDADVRRPRDGVPSRLTPARRAPGFLQRLREIDLFFQGKDPVHQTMRRMAERLEKGGIPYAVVGGMALFAHGYRRATGDVDVLLNPEGLDAFRRQFVGKDYDPTPKRKRRFVDRASGITIDILVTGRFPGTGEPGPIAYPDPVAVHETIDSIRVVRLETLVELKLAAHRFRDFGDVVELIRKHDLDASFAERLHATVRRDFMGCLDEKRREDEYQAREG